MDTDLDARVETHVRGFFAGHAVQVRRWLAGPAARRLPELRVLEVAPGPRIDLVTYVTRGMWAARPDAPLELLMLAREPSARYVELLTMLAFYHATHALGPGHMVPTGEPLLPGSACTHLYLSLPYTFGPALEILELPGGRHLHVLWAFPVTAGEHALWRARGAEALEQAFEDGQVEYWDPRRPSVA